MRPAWNPETYRAPSGRVYTRIADADHGRILRSMKDCGTLLEFNRDVSVASFDRINKIKCDHHWPCWWLAFTRSIKFETFERAEWIATLFALLAWAAVLVWLIFHEVFDAGVVW